MEANFIRVVIKGSYSRKRNPWLNYSLWPSKKPLNCKDVCLIALVLPVVFTGIVVEANFIRVVIKGSYSRKRNPWP